MKNTQSIDFSSPRFVNKPTPVLSFSAFVLRYTCYLISTIALDCVYIDAQHLRSVKRRVHKETPAARTAFHSPHEVTCHIHRFSPFFEESARCRTVENGDPSSVAHKAPRKSITRDNPTETAHTHTHRERIGTKERFSPPFTLWRGSLCRRPPTLRTLTHSLYIHT